MVAFPLSLLALAAGVYLLLKSKKEMMGRLFEGLSWLVIVLSILFMCGGAMRAWHHHRMGGQGYDHCYRGNNGNGPGCCSGMKMNCCEGMNMNCGGSCGGNCNHSCGGVCGGQQNDKPACCTQANDTSKCKDMKGGCCMDKKGTPEKPKDAK